MRRRASASASSSSSGVARAGTIASSAGATDRGAARLWRAREPLKGLILSGGKGTRLRPITHTSAKQLVPVANKPVLFYGLEAIAAAGVTDVGIVVGDTAPAIEEAVGDGSKFGIKVTYIRQQAPLGLAHAVLVARDFLGEDDFVMYLGDNLLKQSLKDFVDKFEEDRRRALSPTLDGE